MDNYDPLLQNDNAFFEELCSSSLDDLRKKYSEKQLTQKVFSINRSYFTTAQYADIQRHFFILNFWPIDKPVVLVNEQRKRIVELIAGLRPESDEQQILLWLKSIDPNLQLPNNWNKNSMQQRAYQLFVGFNNITELLLSSFASEYLPDTLHMYKFDNSKLQKIRTDIQSMTESISSEYQKLIKNPDYQINEQALNNAVEVLKEIGRSQISVRFEIEKASIGHLGDLFVKLDVASKVALILQTMNILDSSEINNAAIEEIKKILRPGIQI